MEELLVAPTAMGQNPGGRLGEWAFNVLEIPDVERRNPLLSLGKELLTHYDLMESLNLSDKRVTNFLRVMETKYDDNPYHCAAHATDVTANVHFLLQSGFVRFFSKLEVLVLCIAALGHDLGHFALNNMFLVNSNHPIVQKHGKVSALEHHHLNEMTEVLEDEECNFLEALSVSDREKFNSLVKELILATDMSRHRDYFTRFEEFCKNAQSDWAGTANTSETEGDRFHNWIEAKIPSVTEEERTLLLVMVVKCADVANVVKPLAQSEAWAMRIMNEFYAQGEKEEALGLPKTQMSKSENVQYQMAKHQLGFLEHVVGPLFTAMMELADVENRAVVAKHIKKNADAWKQRVIETEAREAEASLDPGPS
mmetsp:Transcript_30575/g.51503  ORF Transcript_30575/g.51503 Transcript_30575/m.51503 type:complete len:367 (+) Transcript_30575:209-1309(+)|eukprot:CAMPEP_0198201510 /NCGR_PEP_ID=MMETSP1445-20131203/4394_1 /TAXON_ID=36898 /ORGANISM="Pyramimonas sp., Strain CCMP2087" /LENGTH=366 /DNA_ID=CAMNT_0043871909 /DNA_START=193 /DNA_END=1293 /DNA_ORIENTATION=-